MSNRDKRDGAQRVVIRGTSFGGKAGPAMIVPLCCGRLNRKARRFMQFSAEERRARRLKAQGQMLRVLREAERAGKAAAAAADAQKLAAAQAKTKPKKPRAYVGPNRLKFKSQRTLVLDSGPKVGRSGRNGIEHPPVFRPGLVFGSKVQVGGKR